MPRPTKSGCSRKQLFTFSNNEVKARRYLDDPEGFRFEERDEHLEKKTGYDVREAIDATGIFELASEEEAEEAESNETVFHEEEGMDATINEERAEEEGAEEAEADEEDEEAAEEKAPRKSYK